MIYKVVTATFDESELIPIDWKKFPEALIDILPGHLFFNVLSFDGKKLGQKTVLYLTKTKKLSENEYNLGENITITW